MIWKAHHAKVQVLRISSPPIGERRNFFSRFGMRASLMVAPHGCSPAYHGTMEITMMGSLMIITHGKRGNYSQTARFTGTAL